MSETNEHWYAMRVTYGRELKVEAALKDQFRIYVPKCYKMVERFGKRTCELTSQVPNLLFIYSSIQSLKEVKQKNHSAQSLRFMTNRHGEYIVVPDKQMDDFIRVSQIADDKRIPFVINNPKLLAGQRVRITDGELAGVEGSIVRLHGNKKVVVHIQNLVATAITYLPSAWVTKIEDTEEMIPVEEMPPNEEMDSIEEAKDEEEITEKVSL